jgi:hypothetical protein
MSKIVKNKVSTLCFVLAYICLVCHTSCKEETYSKTGHSICTLCWYRYNLCCHVCPTSLSGPPRGSGCSVGVAWRRKSAGLALLHRSQTVATISPLRLFCDPNLQIENIFTCCCRHWLHTESIRLIVLDLDLESD